MDNTDKKILKILAEDANTSATEIGASVNLSVPAVNKRILKMKNEKVIRSFTITTDEKAVSKPIIAFIMIVVRYSDSVDSFIEYLCSDVDVLECYAVSGEYDYLIKICAKDIEQLENKLLKLKRHKGVVKSHTVFSLMEHKFRPTILPDIQ